MTVADLFGVQSSTSRAQFIFTTFGVTTSRGYEFDAEAARSACAVLPSPGSSASRKLRWPSRTLDTNAAWWVKSSSPAGTRRSAAVGSGSSMLATLPPAPYSNARNSGSRSSQLASRRLVGLVTFGWEKSGARKGLDSWRATTDCGTTWRSAAGSRFSGSLAMISSSGLSSTPDAINRSRRSRLAASDTVASSPRS